VPGARRPDLDGVPRLRPRLGVCQRYDRGGTALRRWRDACPPGASSVASCSDDPGEQPIAPPSTCIPTSPGATTGTCTPCGSDAAAGIAPDGGESCDRLAADHVATVSAALQRASARRPELAWRRRVTAAPPTGNIVVLKLPINYPTGRRRSATAADDALRGRPGKMIRGRQSHQRTQRIAYDCNGSLYSVLPRSNLTSKTSVRQMAPPFVLDQ
jgi:hypothetical protein